LKANEIAEQLSQIVNVSNNECFVLNIFYDKFSCHA